MTVMIYDEDALTVSNVLRGVAELLSDDNFTAAPEVSAALERHLPQSLWHGDHGGWRHGATELFRLADHLVPVGDD